MNCQDISRLIDTCDFHALTDMQRGEAQAHAEACRHCAPLWFAHSRLAAARIPAMPAELAVRCFTLAAGPAQAHATRHASRRIMVIAGALVVLAAAAAMLTSGFFGGDAPPRPQSAIANLPAATTAVATSPQEIESPAAEPLSQPVAPAIVTKLATAGLPLLPAPLSADQERRVRSNLAMQKALELYPQLTEGPTLADDQQFVVYLAMRRDGKVFEHAMELATRENSQEVSDRLSKPGMNLMGGLTHGGAPKGQSQPDGRRLRGYLRLIYAVAGSDFDPLKSSGAVQDIVRTKHPELLLPAGREGLKTLTLFLSDDGRIKSESVDVIRPEEMMKQAERTDMDEAPGISREIAGKLGLSTDQFGVVGFTFMTGDAKPASDEGSSVPPQRPGALLVFYAFPRHSGDLAPTLLDATGNRELGIDKAAATVIVERLMPDAFAFGMRDYPAGKPTLVLTSEGEVLRAAFVKSEDMHLQTRDLAPGRVSMSGGGATLVNNKGQRADVQFLWQHTQAQKDAAEEAIKAATVRPF